MTIHDFVKAASGKDANGSPKAVIGLTRELWHLDGREPEREEDIVLENHDTIVHFTNGYCNIDLDFKTKFNPELNTAWDFLENYSAEAIKYSDNENEAPMLLLTIVPSEFKGTYFAVIPNPLFHSLQPAKVGEDACVIRLVFNAEDFTIYEASDE